MSIDDIENTVFKIVEDLKNNTFKESNYLSFKEKYNSIYDMATSDGMDLTIFKKLISMKRKLDDGADPYSTDVEVGQIMADKYINPVIKKMDSSKN